jgi:hypothetical protein
MYMHALDSALSGIVSRDALLTVSWNRLSNRRRFSSAEIPRGG